MHDALPTARLLAVARGEAEPDVVVEGARVFGAFTREWLEGDVGIADGRFAGIGSYEGGERIDGSGHWLSAGFIDAHMHVESSKLTVAELARVLAARGTTTIVCDPHELANALGPEGVHWFIDSCANLPLDVLSTVPACVPASPFESPRAPLSLADQAGILARDGVLGLAEMMNFPAVIAGAPDELAKLALAAGKRVDGHAPGVRGAALDAYLATGIATDHEATTVEEALEKRRKGAWVLLREASNARNLRTLLPLVRDYGPERCAFCTDDREPDMLLREGHIDQMCRVAVAEGVTPEDALLLATLHPALCHGLPRVGAIAPGYRADCVLLEDLGSFRAALVLKDGLVVARDGVTAPFEPAPAPDWVRDSVRIAPLPADAFALPHAGDHVRAIGLIRDQILTEHLVVTPSVRGGEVVADHERDLAKIAVIERHHASGRIGLGLVRGFGLRRGAVATTVAHDAHNIVAVGVDDDDLAHCVERLAEIGGGIAIYERGELRAELALPIAGLMSALPVEAVVEQLDHLHAVVRELGSTLAAPFMALSFLALSVIPALKITDRGLVDVERFAIVPFDV
ncbi:MAG: adenine deaminase [Gaiellales bacterium]|jgi:adenine deaminase|nr:adenine deaminase [Gaiellales bacterium]